MVVSVLKGDDPSVRLGGNTHTPNIASCACTCDILVTIGDGIASFNGNKLQRSGICGQVCTLVERHIHSAVLQLERVFFFCIRSIHGSSISSHSLLQGVDSSLQFLGCSLFILRNKLLGYNNFGKCIKGGLWLLEKLVAHIGLSLDSCLCINKKICEFLVQSDSRSYRLDGYAINKEVRSCTRTGTVLKAQRELSEGLLI